MPKKLRAEDGRTADRFCTRKVTSASRDMNRHLAGADPRDQHTIRKMMQTLKDGVRDCPIIVADNVQPVAAAAGLNSPDLFPCLTPPWPFFTLEYPSSSHQERRLVIVNDVTEVWRGEKLPGWDDEIDGPVSSKELDLLGFKGVEEDLALNDFEGDIKWMVIFQLFIEANGQIMGPALRWTLGLDDRGVAVGNHYAYLFNYDAPDRGGPPIKGDGSSVSAEEWAGATLQTAWHTISFLHCRNTELVTIEPDTKLSAAHSRRFGTPMLRTQQVRIKVPGRAVKDDRPRREPSGVELPQRIVPGHFAHYGDCCQPTPSCTSEHGFGRCSKCGGHEPHGLLFGRLQGMFWIESRATGNPAVGRIKTDYDLAVSAAS